MTIIKDKNNLDLETLIEFARVGVSLNVSRFTAAPPGTLFDKLRDSLEPSILQDRGDEGDLIRDRNLLFCEPRVLAEDLTTCPACVPDPNAFVPDWRASPDGLIFLINQNVIMLS